MEATLDPGDHLSEHRFQIAVKRLADSLAYGTDPSPFVGSGIEYVQSRPYQPGDPVKSIDWRITARTGKVFVKEYEAPRQTPVHILLDTSASMCVSSVPRSKYAAGVQLAGGIALAAMSRISPVGITACGSRSFHTEPTLSRPVLFSWLFHLRRYRADEPTHLGARLRDLAASLPTRALLVVISDLHDPDALPALKRAAQQHDCIVLLLRDPAESGRLAAGFFRGEEAETGAGFTGHGRSRWGDPHAEAERLKQAGIDHLLLWTDDAFVPRLRNFLRQRHALGRGKR